MALHSRRANTLQRGLIHPLAPISKWKEARSYAWLCACVCKDSKQKVGVCRCELEVSEMWHSFGEFDRQGKQKPRFLYLFANFLSTPFPPLRSRGENCKINRAKWSFHGSHWVSSLSAGGTRTEQKQSRHPRVTSSPSCLNPPYSNFSSLFYALSSFIHLEALFPMHYVKGNITGDVGKQTVSTDQPMTFDTSHFCF